MAEPFLWRIDKLLASPQVQLFARPDIITLHCPLTPETYHLVNEDAMRSMAEMTLSNITQVERGQICENRI